MGGCKQEMEAAQMVVKSQQLAGQGNQTLMMRRGSRLSAEHVHTCADIVSVRGSQLSWEEMARSADP